MQVRVESVNVTLRDLWALVLVLPDPVEMLHIVGPSQELHKILVVGDNKELEVALARTTLDYPTKKPKVDVLVTSRDVTVWDFQGMIIVSENITVSRYTVLNNQNRFFLVEQMFGSMGLFKFH